MRKPNGFGSIKKLSGNRRRPYVYVITRPDGKRQALAYFENQTEAENATLYVPVVAFGVLAESPLTDNPFPPWTYAITHNAT